MLIASVSYISAFISYQFKFQVLLFLCLALMELGLERKPKETLSKSRERSLEGMKEIRVSENSRSKENRSHHLEKEKGVNKPCSCSLRHSSSVFPAALKANTDVTLTLRAKDLNVCVFVCVCVCIFV